MPENACRTPVRLPQATIYAGVQLVKAFDKGKRISPCSRLAIKIRRFPVDGEAPDSV